MARGPFVPAFPELDDAALSAEIEAAVARLKALRRERMRRAGRVRMLELHKRPGFRQKFDAALVRAATDPAVQEKRRALLRARMADPDVKAKLVAANRARALARYGFIIPERYRRHFGKLQRVLGSAPARAEIKRLVALEDLAAQQTAEAERQEAA